MIPSLENYKAWWERAVEDRDRYRDAYLAQREIVEAAHTYFYSMTKENYAALGAALSAAPLAPETQNEGEK